MFDRTSTSVAPWTLVEANDKLHARVKVIETVVARLRRTLGELTRYFPPSPLAAANDRTFLMRAFTTLGLSARSGFGGISGLLPTAAPR